MYPLREHPVVDNQAEQGDEFAEAGWLLEVGVYAQAIGLPDVLLVTGTVEHHNRQFAKLRMSPHPAQDLQPVHLPHLKVCDDKIGERKPAAIRKLAFTLQVLNYPHAVSDLAQANVFVTNPLKGKLEQTPLVGYVFGEQDVEIVRHTDKLPYSIKSQIAR